MKKTLLLLAIFLYTGVQVVMAQSKTVTGTVVDDNNEPLPGMAVKVKGSQTGTVTDLNGSFELVVPDGSSDELEISGIGGNKTVRIEGTAPLMVKLDNAGTGLDEVVITTGYVSQVKEKFVGAADRIDAKQIAKFPVSSLTKAIEGAAPGIQTTNGGGAPGSTAAVRIRGFGSISASSAPLYVVDGSPYLGDINSINPSDIASITVLKDATATSLYGSRGANGVIVVTTKGGKRNNTTQISVDAKVGTVTRSIPNYNVMTSEKDYYETAWDAYRNSMVFGGGYDWDLAGRIASGLEPGEEPGLVTVLGGYNSYNVANDQLLDPVTGKLNPNATLKYHDDWNKELQRTGLRQDYNLSFAGGNEKSDYYFSAGYLKEKGYIKFSDYDRFTARLNVNAQATDWLKVGMNASGALSTTNFLTSSNSPGYNPFLISRTFAPIYPVYYRDANNNFVTDPIFGGNKYDWGSLEQDPENSMGDRATGANSNVLGAMNYDVQRNKVTNFIFVPYLEAKFLKNFTLRTDINVNYYGTNSTDYNNPVYGQFAQQGGTISRGTSNGLIYTWKQLLTYARDFDLHHVDVVAGHETYWLNTTSQSASRAGLASLGNLDLAGAAVATGSSSYTDNDRMESYLANVNYDYNSTYFLTANVRRDGSSRFAKKWGTFWSVGGAYMINKAEFLRDVKAINVLKLKASYGTSGNNGIGTYYGYQSLYDLDFANGSNAGAAVARIANPDLTWETQGQFNVGVEGKFWDRLGVEVNYFQKTNADLLFNRPFPSSTGINSRLENTITMKNSGIEFNLNADIVKTRNFTWNVNFNLTHFNNVITKMPEGIDSLINGNRLWKKGHSIYEFYLLESTGVDPETGADQFAYINADGGVSDTSVYSYAQARGGRDYRGSSIPKVFGAFTSNLSYKNFDFSFMLSYSVGGKYYDAIYQSLMTSGTYGDNFSEDVLTDRWTNENRSGTIPRLETNYLESSAQSTRYLIDGSYLSLRNINLGYSFPENVAKKAKLKSLRAYVSADNIFLLSKRKGMDPQATYDGVSSTAIYNAARTIMFGLSVGL